MKRIKHWLVVFSLLCLFFENNSFSEWWKMHFECSQNQNFLPCKTIVEKSFLYFCGSISTSFLKMEKSKSSLYFSFRHYQGFSESQRRKHKLKTQYIVKMCVKWITCLNWLSNCVSNVGCPFWPCRTLPFSSKRGPGQSR